MQDTNNLHTPFDGIALIADPIHNYISITVPYDNPDPSEMTEKDLIDSPWVQRLRFILQLQSAHWVYPGAEHTRFQHSLGTMHLAGRFIARLYPSLRKTFPHLPSYNYMEAFIRITALLHDVGHGPFCHFFDHHFLHQFHLTHEILGQQIIREELGEVIRRIRRSPSGPFAPGEVLDPNHIAFLIQKHPRKSQKGLPKWLIALQPLIGGIYTPDNCDYVLRDSYMCGVAIGPVDIERLLHYTFFSSHGLTIHQTGLAALQMFLQARLYLYTNVYYHRTTRAIDIHLQEIFQQTMKFLFPYNPMHRLTKFLHLTDWSLLESVRTWSKSRSKPKQRLGQEWEEILRRRVRYKMAFSALLPLPSSHSSLQPETFRSRMQKALPPQIAPKDFHIDFAHKDPRPVNLLNMGNFQIYVYNSGSGLIEKDILHRYLQHLPARMITLRIFCKDPTSQSILATAAKQTLRRYWPHMLKPTQ